MLIKEVQEHRPTSEGELKMIDLLFVFINLLVASLYDAWRMTRSVLIYWGYGASSDTSYNPGISNDGTFASDEGELSMFAFWYFYVISLAVILYCLGYYSLGMAIGSVLSVLWLHWTGNEDLGYYFGLLFFKNPKKYEDTHEFVNVFGVQIPASLYWLALPRKIGFITIPSIIGWVCGKDVPGKKFVRFAVFNIILVVVLHYLLLFG
jgi:hypothetical protein